MVHRLSACSSTTIAKMLVPALTLPVRGATELVATMPVPASPSGGHSGAPGRSAPVGSSSPAPASVSSPAGVAGDRGLGQQVDQPQVGAGLGRRAGRTGDMRGVVVAGRRVDREHPGGVADAEHLLAGEPPVHVAGERREERDAGDVRLGVEDRLVEVRDDQRSGMLCRTGAQPLGGLHRSWCCARCGTASSSSPSASNAR